MALIVPVRCVSHSSPEIQIHDSHSIPDWRFWVGTESDRRYILQVQWRQDSCEVDLPRGNDSLTEGRVREKKGRKALRDRETCSG